MFKSFIFTFLLSLIGLSQASELEINAQAPEFSVKGQDGKTYTLSEMRGQYVILEWYNRDCPFVRKFYDVNKMQELQKKYNSMDNVSWFKIVSSAPGEQGHMNPKDTKKNMKKEKSQVVATLLDEDGVVGRAYNARTTPQMVIIDPQGVVRYDGAIDSIRSTSSDDIPKATNFLDQAMTELLAGNPVSVSRTQPYGCSVKYKN